MSTAARPPEVTVVGSLNVDHVLEVRRLPEPGETVLGSDLREFAGGKGSNQAVAAARLGRTVAMVGLVGDDHPAGVLRETLQAEGIGQDTLGAIDGARSGVAYIFVDEEGENTVVVSPGANARLTADDVRAAGDVVRRADVVVAQMEIPEDSVDEAVRLAEGTVVLNPAPARPVDQETLRQVDVLVPNRSELGVLTGEAEPRTIAEATALARSLDGPGAVVVTLGSDGALLVDGDAHTHVPAPEVEVADPTGAGDTFCGALADALVRGADTLAAVRWAVQASALAVTALGAQAAMPTAEQVRAVHE